MPPLVSIIIPAYNSADTIVEALESVAAQTSWAAKTLDLRLQTSDQGEKKTLDLRLQTTDQKAGEEGDQTPSSWSNVHSLKSNVSPAYEVIIVDDCSTDSTVSVVKAWLGKNGKQCDMDRPGLHPAVAGSTAGRQDGQDRTWKASFILPLHSASLRSEVYGLKSEVYGLKSEVCSLWSVVSLRSNAGPAKARNQGIREATGEWLAFLDSDDVWVPYKIELQLRMAAKYPDVVLWGTSARIIHQAVCVNMASMAHKMPAVEDTCPALEDVVSVPVSLEEMAMQNRVGTSNVLVRRSVVEAVGGFDERFRGPEDYDLWLRIVARHPIRNISADLTLYRQRAGSLSMDDRKFLPQVMRVLEKAYGQGGALVACRQFRRRALASQYLSAGRMALECGARGRAIRHLVLAWLWYPLVGGWRQPAIWYTFLFKPWRIDRV